MNDHPLGFDPDEQPPMSGVQDNMVTIDSPESRNGVKAAVDSVVDKVLDLNELLSRDVRLAERQAVFYINPEIEAAIDGLNAELDAMTDSQGRPLKGIDVSLEDSRTPEVVAAEITALQKEYAASQRVVVMRQMDSDDWAEFQSTWKKALAEQPPYPPEFYAALISRCAIQPKISEAEVGKLRKALGGPAFDTLWSTAWTVNTVSGVSIPKSLLSSVVLRPSQRG